MSRDDARYFREKAKQFRELAEKYKTELSVNLRRLAEEFDSKAAEIEENK